jgi:hypothetical protein
VRPAATSPAAPAETALLAAAEALSVDEEARAWVERASSSPNTAGAPPARVREAVRALVAWDRSGAPLTFNCDNLGGASMVSTALALTRASLGLARTADDAAVHAVLRLGHALREPPAGAAAAAGGCAIATAALDWLRDRGLRPSADFTALAPHPDTALRAARADLGCAIEWAELLDRSWTAELESGSASHRDAAGATVVTDIEAELEARRQALDLPSEPGWVEAELPAWRAFWRETERLVAGARSVDRLLAIYRSRREAMLRHPSSFLLRQLADMLLSPGLPDLVDALARNVRRYRDDLAALEAR